jgi:hypothetical protein
VEPSQVSVQTKQVSFRRVYWSFRTVKCPRCGHDTPRVWDITRSAVDIDLDQPIVLAVEVSVHVCATCSRMFRAQPPFLRPGAIYTRRVVQKSHRRGVPRRTRRALCAGSAGASFLDQARRKDGATMVSRLRRRDRLCHRLSAVGRRQLLRHPVRRRGGDLALLLAVDPAAPDGDRLDGYTLLPKTKEVDQTMVRTFIYRLRTAGVHPDEVITDDLRLYPAVLKEIWPTASHQLCLFHATRRVVRAVSDVVKQVGRNLPTPPPASKPTLLGRMRDTPPDADQRDPDAERYSWRMARRTPGIARVHDLHKHITSARTIGRQLGVNHGTVRQWLKLKPPDLSSPPVSSRCGRKQRLP